MNLVWAITIINQPSLLDCSFRCGLASGRRKSNMNRQGHCLFLSKLICSFLWSPLCPTSDIWTMEFKGASSLPKEYNYWHRGEQCFIRCAEGGCFTTDFNDTSWQAQLNMWPENNCFLGAFSRWKYSIHGDFWSIMPQQNQERVAEDARRHTERSNLDKLVFHAKDTLMFASFDASRMTRDVVKKGWWMHGIDIRRSRRFRVWKNEFTYSNHVLVFRKHQFTICVKCIK